MNVLSVIVPSYNSEDYLVKCVSTLVESGENIEIIIVNDGSTDNTGKLADDYLKAYTDRIKVIHQDNAGHGGAVNIGISNATGRYIKVVDSDDWINPKALKSVVKKLKNFIDENKKVDMLLTNFIYDKVGSTQKKVMHYRDTIPKNKVITWDEVGRFKPSKYILMHSVIYSIDVIRQSGLVLPKHTFYVDNLFAYIPLLCVDSIYYMDECVYHYFIGREEQSVNEKNMIKKIDQQLLVNRIMLKTIDLETVYPRKKRLYMMHYLNIVTTVSTVLLLKIGTKKAIMKKKELWCTIKKIDLYLYFKMRTSLLGSIINIPGIMGRKITLFAYKTAQKRVGFS